MKRKRAWRFVKLLFSRSPGPELPPIELSDEVQREVEQIKARRGPGF